MDGSRRAGGFAPFALGGLYLLVFLRQIHHLHLHVWSDPKYSHAYLVPLVGAWWLWRERKGIAKAPRRPADAGLILVAAGLLLWFAFLARFRVNALAHASMMLTLVGMVAFAGGFRFLGKVAFPVGYLLFCFPVPERLDTLHVVLPLQGLAAGISERIIDFLGIPVLRDRNILEVPGCRLFVEEACSGIHSLYALMAVGTFYVFFTTWRAWARALLVALTVPVAVAANVVRVTLSGIVAYHGGAGWVQGASHETMGLAVFGAGLLLFFGAAALVGRLGGAAARGGGA